MLVANLQFIQRFERFGVASGMPKSMARVLGYLTVCEPARQTASQIQAELQLSAGSVSSALNMLRHAGIIRRYEQQDDRHYYYELDTEAWRRATIQRLHSLGAWAELAQSGLKDHPKNMRLTQMRDTYLMFEKEFAEITRKLESQ